MPSKHVLYGISEAARRAGVAEGTLREYDRRGIVNPVRDSARRRLFSAEDIEHAIQHRLNVAHESTSKAD